MIEVSVDKPECRITSRRDAAMLRGLDSGVPDMTEALDQVAATIHEQFLEYYDGFLEIAERAPALFVAGELHERVKDDLLRAQLYRSAINQSEASVQAAVEGVPHDYARWVQLREEFSSRYADELARTYFTSVMRRILAQQGIATEFENDGVEHRQVESSAIVHHYPIAGRAHLRRAIQSALNDSVFSGSLSVKCSQDTDLVAEIIDEQLTEEADPTSVEVLGLPFFRRRGAYLVGQFGGEVETTPVVFGLVSTPEGVQFDAVLVGYQATRNFLFSSTRSAFTVSTKHYQELYSFLQRLFPDVNPAYILDLIGFGHPAKISLLKQLRQISEAGEQCQYVGTGPLDLVFRISGLPLVFKVLKRGLRDRESIIDNFTKVHGIDRLGQVLDSIDYKNLKFERGRLSPELIDKLEEERPDDVVFTRDHIMFKRVFASRRVVPVDDYLRTAGKEETRAVLLGVGWNIKHLTSMGLLPSSLGLEHFGVTTWRRVVYLNNASLIDIREFDFHHNQESKLVMARHNADPAIFERELNIPEQHRDMFRAVHGDLYLAHFWEDNKSRAGEEYLDVFPYPAQYRLGSRSFRRSVREELQRLGDEVDEKQIHVVLDNLAVVDVELAGLNFLRLEVPHPSARVLVIEPIGPEIIAQLHRQFQDVTFDILQSESEVVESAGQWTPGIHGKLKALVQIRKYDYVIGYVNETFDREFFRLAKLKGFLLLSTGIHNIDVEAATELHTVVTNAPGPTTTTVAEQNIALMLEAVYSDALQDGDRTKGSVCLARVRSEDVPPLAVAQILWLHLLKSALRLDEMFLFGASAHYVRTGVGEYATVYHDQIGQNREAGISRRIGVMGLGKTGLHLVEIAIANEVSTVFLLEDEYQDLPLEEKERLGETITIVEEISQTEELSIQIVPVGRSEFFERTDYIFNTETDGQGAFTIPLGLEGVLIDVRDIFVRDLGARYASAISNLTLGIQGLGRIGEAVAQRAIALGMSVQISQRDPGRPSYQMKRARLIKLADHVARWTGQSLSVDYTEDKGAFFAKSNIITTLAASTERTRGWVDQEGLDQFATQASSPVRVLVSAGKGLVDEDALIRFLVNNPDAEARLDVLTDEHEGGAHLKLVDDQGSPLENSRVTGHTAAAVREVRRLKVFKALDNLRNLIDGIIPPNIVNNVITPGKSEETHSIVEIEGLAFFRMSVPSPRARVLIIEPLPPEMVLQLQRQFGDISVDILLAESELVEVDGQWTPGINARLNRIVSSQQYDYCLGYCNADFDARFFRQARLKGLILFATATHHIDFDAATEAGTVVTNSPGFTTVAVTEQNMGMALDALYGRYVQEYASEGALALSQLDVSGNERASAVAQILWFTLLRRALKLDDMYQFGSGDKYVRTGIRRDATVYHDQLGQDEQADINNSIGVIGLDEVGLNLVELAFAHELSTVYLLEEEYQSLSEHERARLDEMARVVGEVSQTKSFSVQLLPVERDELIREATYTIKTPAAYRSELLEEIKTKSAIAVHADRVYINDPCVFERSMVGSVFGVQGLGRIGEAVVQRALALGANVIVCQRDPDRPRYQQKRERLRRLALNRARVHGKTIDFKYVDKEELFRTSNVVTTLAATTSTTRYWVDREALDMLASDASGPVKVLVNAGKGLLNEADLGPFLRDRPDVEVRLDVLTDEQKGKAGERFRDAEGRPLTNLRISGHTAAAVPELRRLKVFNALNNLRLHIDGKKPNNILNPDVV